MDIGRHSEGATNINTTCPCEKKHKGFYIYVGPPKGKKMPGMSFCHRCTRGWGLHGLLKELGAPGAVLADVTEALQSHIAAGLLHSKLRETFAVEDRIPILNDALLGMYDGYWPKKLLEAGFSKEILREFDVGYDTDRGRTTFAIRDHLGRLASVSGRASDNSDPQRYRVYTARDYGGGAPKDYEPSKGLVLYGMFRFYAARMLGQCDPRAPIVLTEGFKACMHTVMAGVQHTVALMGPYITDAQMHLLQRTTSRVVLFLDDDNAGREGTSKAMPQLRSAGIRVRVANYPNPEDLASPDDLGQHEVLSAIKDAVTEHTWRASYGYYEEVRRYDGW